MPNEPPTIDLWSFSLDCDSDVMSLAEALLSDEERARADRHRFDRHRRSFVVRRSMRRIVLAHLTRQRPEKIRFDESDHGKPRVANNDAAIEFNSSDSGDRGIIVTATCPLGVDIEPLDRPMDYLDFARRSFTSEEYADIEETCENNRSAVFFNCWTGKEAYVKALGLGLRKKLRSFAVRCAADQPPGLRWDEESPEHPAAYSFMRYTDDEYVATIALNHEADAIEPTWHELSTSSLRQHKPIESESGPQWRKF